MNIDVQVPASQNISVTQSATSKVSVNTNTLQVSTQGALPQQNLWVSSTKPAFSGPGMWIQTGMGPTGEDFTIWFEDGK